MPDASLILGIKPPQIQQVDPIDRFGKLLAVKNMQMQGDVAERGMADDEAVRQAYVQSGGDSARLRALLQQGGQYKPLQALDKFELERRDKEASIGAHNATAGKANYDVEKDKIERVSSILSVAKDQPSWDMVRRALIIQHPQAAEHLPQQYDPAFIQTQIAQGQTLTQRLEDQRKQEELGLKKANEPFTAGPNGPVPNQTVQDFQLQKSKAGAPTVSVNTEKSFLGNLAEAVGKDVAAQATAAQGAVTTIQSTNQIRDALASGKVQAGPGTTLKMSGGQLAQALGFSSDSEGLVQTRNVIQGLAKLALAARSKLKGQGQISDFEGRVLTKAETGDIDNLSLAEVKVIADVADRAARFEIKRNKVNVDKLNKNPNAKSVAEFMNVDEPPAYAAPTGAQPAPTMDEINAELRRRGVIK